MTRLLATAMLLAAASFDTKVISPAYCPAGVPGARRTWIAVGVRFPAAPICNEEEKGPFALSDISKPVGAVMVMLCERFSPPTLKLAVAEAEP